MLRISKFIFLFLFLFSCKENKERDIISKWIPENKYILLASGWQYQREYDCCSIMELINDSTYIIKSLDFDEDDRGCLNHDFLGRTSYNFVYSYPTSLTSFMSRNNFYPVCEKIEIDTFFYSVKKSYKKNRTDSIANKIIYDTIYTFYNDENHKFYCLYHINSRHRNEIRCLEISKNDILKCQSAKNAAEP